MGIGPFSLLDFDDEEALIQAFKEVKKSVATPEDAPKNPGAVEFLYMDDLIRARLGEEGFKQFKAARETACLKDVVLAEKNAALQAKINEEAFLTGGASMELERLPDHLNSDGMHSRLGTPIGSLLSNYLIGSTVPELLTLPWAVRFVLRAALFVAKVKRFFKRLFWLDF